VASRVSRAGPAWSRSVARVARQRGISWERIAEMTAGGPARLWRLAPKKGALRVGADADLTLIDPDAEWVVTKDELLHTQNWSPFEGRKIRGRVVRTLLRGKTVYRIDAEERVPVGPGFGRFVPRQDDNIPIAPSVAYDSG
jgi:allantoinase